MYIYRNGVMLETPTVWYAILECSAFLVNFISLCTEHFEVGLIIAVYLSICYILYVS